MDNIIDNSALLPAYRTDELVELEPSEPGGKPMTPDWAKSLIMMEVHLETATPEGTFEAGIRVLDHCAELGVNCIWLTPIYEKGEGGNGYGNCGPHTVEPALTGVGDPDEGWRVVKRFVDEAHRRNIRILLDIITWGTVSAAPLCREHPDWYKGEAWGGKAFDWSNSEFVDWYVSVAIDNIIKTGADGYRCDCEPIYTGYKVFNRVREGCLARGRKILVMAEDGCDRADCFDMEQDGVLWYKDWSRGDQYKTPKRFYLDELDIVDSVKSGVGIGSAKHQSGDTGGQYRFYTYCVSNHDFQYSITNRNRLVMGYQAIFAPFIPLWYFGGEFNMRAERQVIYFVPVDWSKLNDAENARFFEDIKRYIRIRRSYPEIFEYWPEDHRRANICRVEAGTGLCAYARYAGGRAITVVPNPLGYAIDTTVAIPCGELGITGDVRLTDLLTGDAIRTDGRSFGAHIEGEAIGVYLAE